MAKLTDRRSFLRTSAAAGATAMAGALPEVARAAFNDPIAGVVSLGVVAPFTGDQIRLGEQIGNGVRAACDDANRLRTSLDRIYQMRTYDDQNLLASGLVNAGFACDDLATICVIGHLSGRITDAALQKYAEARMPILVPASTYDPITSHAYGNVLRLPTKDTTEGRLAARYVMDKLKPKTSVVLYQDGDYGADVAAGFHDEVLDSKLASVALRFSWEKPDFPAVAKATADDKPDVVYLAGVAKDMGPVVKALRDAGYAGPLYASQGFFDAATLQKYKTECEGLIVSSSMPPLNLAPTDFRVRADFEQRYGAFTPLSAFSYAAAQIAICAIRRNAATDRNSLARALAISSPWDTVVGTFQFQNDGDPINPNVYFYTVTGGAWKYVQASHPTGFILK